MTWRRVPRRPTRWLFYGIGAVSAVALVATEIVAPSGAVRSALQVAIIAVTLALARIWIESNRGAIEMERWSATRPSSTLAPSDSIEQNGRRRPRA